MMPVNKNDASHGSIIFFRFFCGKLLKLFFCFSLLYSEIVSKDKRMNWYGHMDVKEKGEEGRQDENKTRREKRVLEEKSEKRSLSDHHDHTGYYLLSGFLLFSDDGLMDGIYAV